MLHRKFSKKAAVKSSVFGRNNPQNETLRNPLPTKKFVGEIFVLNNANTFLYESNAAN